MDESEKAKRILRTPILHVFDESVTDQKKKSENLRSNSMYAEHTASKSCVPDSKTNFRPVSSFEDTVELH